MPKEITKGVKNRCVSRVGREQEAYAGAVVFINHGICEIFKLRAYTTLKNVKF